jgi:uncharacterized protein (TIGR03437 family)
MGSDRQGDTTDPGRFSGRGEDLAPAEVGTLSAAGRVFISFTRLGGRMKFLCACGALCVFAATAAAQPSITNVVNNASGIVQALPNGGIAQGSLFLVTGSGLGPTPLVVDSSSKPFQQTTLAGTSVSVTIGSSTTNALMYYTSDGQVSALLPSNTPTGTGTVTVTYNGQASATSPITVVQNNPGIFTWTQNGQGIAIVTYPDYSVVSAIPGSGNLSGTGPGKYFGAANPGDTLILWATGLGPVSGSDGSGAGLGQNMPNIQLAVWLGGVQAPVSYQGRSGCCIGEDQIVFGVPANVPTGCAVPIVLQVGNNLSNYGVIPIANGSRSCTPSSPTLTSSVVQSLSGPNAPINYGQISLRRQLASASNGLQYVDVGQGTFAQITIADQTQPLLLSYLDTEPLGTCLVSNSLTPSTSLPTLTTNGIDAGRISIAGPGGTQFMTEHAGFGQPTQYVVTLSSSGTYLSAGNYTITGAGGNDVGSFSAKLTVTAPSPSWPSTEQFTVSNGITRANGVVINWINPSSNYFIEISGRVATDSTLTTGASYTCLVSSTLSTFTVPANVLLAMPAASPYGEIDFKPTVVPVPYTANHLTFGSVSLNYQTALFPPYI